MKFLILLILILSLSSCALPLSNNDIGHLQMLCAGRDGLESVNVGAPELKLTCRDGSVIRTRRVATIVN